MPPRADSLPPLMCLTQDGTGVRHSVQVERLCAAGARLIQLRMKGSSPAAWVDEARLAVGACRRHGAVLIVNDSIDVTLESGADGVHLGSHDTPWEEARRLLGPDRIVGGTVNTERGAREVPAGVLDYAGVGPLRFTSTKSVLAPILGLEGVRGVIRALGGLPAWVIGGVTPGDAAALRAAGARGMAVSSPLHRSAALEENLAPFLASWHEEHALP